MVSSDLNPHPDLAGRTLGRYFAAFSLRLASARRSIFFRRRARFLTLSLPWLFPISFNTRPLVAPYQFVGGSCAGSKLFRCVPVKNIRCEIEGRPDSRSTIHDVTIVFGRFPSPSPLPRGPAGAGSLTQSLHSTSAKRVRPIYRVGTDFAGSASLAKVDLRRPRRSASQPAVNI
jgi:hypothetical protein